MLLKVEEDERDIDDPLCDVLRGAVTDGALPDELSAQLCVATVFVLQHPEANLSESDTSAGRVSLAVQQVNGLNCIAVYSSLNAVEALAPEGSAYAGLLGFTLFGMWGPHDWLILNPGSRYQLLASPEELSAVVSGADVRVDIVR